MVIRCPGCSGALRWSPKLQKLKCIHCESLYDAKELNSPDYEKDTIECNIFACTSCGAELAINDVEAATFCAYCGQPAIVFERVSEILRPARILPFKVDRDEAESIIRARFRKGTFVPRSIKNFEVERMSGIYVPYRIYDIQYHDRQVISGKQNKTPRTWHRKATTVFKGIETDASRNFCNESSDRLAPFELGGMVAFHEAYLSGFYADRYDDKPFFTELRAKELCKDMFDKEVLKSIQGGSDLSVDESKPKHKILQQEYVLLPVWFLTLRYKDKPYTMLVNGQNGKIIGSVPFAKFKAVAAFLGLLVFLLLIFPGLFVWIFRGVLPLEEDWPNGFVRLAVWFVPTLLFYGTGWSICKKMKANRKRTTAKALSEYAGERQEEPV